MPIVDLSLEIAPQRKTSMLLDTGAQISLINKKVIKDPSRINIKNKIKIASIHGSENTLGDISTAILENNTTIPIQLQVTTNKFLKEDGILGYDVIGDNGIINGPEKTLTINSGHSQVKIPIKITQNRNKFNNKDIETSQLNQINYLSKQEIHPQYETNLQRVRSLTEELSDTKIKINPVKHEQ